MKASIYACCWLLLITGCSSAPPQKAATYLLRSTDAAEAVEFKESGERAIGLAPVVLADYLQGDGIILELDGSRIHSAQYHLWAEPLSLSVRQVVASKLEKVLRAEVDLYSSPQSWDIEIELFVDQLHGTRGGDIKISARWLVTDRHSGQRHTGRKLTSTQLGDRGYDALVQSHQFVLTDLAADIARTVKLVAPD